MEEKQICQVCGKAVASLECRQCGKPLCELCRKEFYHDDPNPWCRTLGTQLSQIWTGETVYHLCPDCFQNTDILVQERDW